MRQATTILNFRTGGRGFLDVTAKLRGWAEGQAMEEGLLTLFIRHTSASILVQENADPDVLADLAEALDRLAPRDHPYHHMTEGPDDMPAHIKAALTATSLAIPLIGGHLALGTWQAVYLVEHRDRPHTREIACHLMGK